MPIVECHIVATTPPFIYLVMGSDDDWPADAKPKVEEWQVNGKKVLGSWVTTPAGRSVPGGYAYTLRAARGTNTRWVNPGTLVNLDAVFTVGDGSSHEECDCIVESGPQNGPSDELIGLRDGIEDLVGFPLITGTSDAAGTAGGTSGPGGQALVDAEIRRVLGRTPAQDDVKGTLALMDRITQMDVENGVPRLTFQRSAYVAQAQIGDLVTGRQASVAGLAQETLAFVRPLAEHVEPLAQRSDNPALLETARSNFLAAATDAVAEAGIAGGPVTPRANVLLDQSLDQLGRFGWELGVLAFAEDEERLAPTRKNVITPRDEDQFTAFLLILERWRVFHDSFRRYLNEEGRTAEKLFDFDGGAGDFGLEFTRLDRVVDVIAEAVEEVDLALATVGIDRREREAMRLDGGMTVADVMDWAQSFAEREARPLIQQSGIKGVELLPPRLEALGKAVKQLQDSGRKAGAPRGLRHPRVKVAVAKLLRELNRAQDSAKEAQAVTRP